MSQRSPRAPYSLSPPWNSGPTVDTQAPAPSTESTATSTHSVVGFHPTI